MPDSGNRFAWATVAVWTLAVGGSLAWNIHHEHTRIMAQARAETVANFNKDITFRRWGNSHGGVYVPVTEAQQPVPWLEHLPDRDVTTTDGRRLTLLNPATMLRQVMDRYSAEHGVKGRITGLRYLNPGNAPDAWERERMEAFARGDAREAWATADLGGEPHLRYLRVMYMEPGCEKCHAALGYRPGDVRGAIGVNMPLTPYLSSYRSARVNLTLSHGGIWLLGLAGIGWSARQQARQTRERTRMADALSESEERFDLAMAGASDGIWDMNLETGAMYHSPRMREMLGYGRDDLPPDMAAWRNVLHPDDYGPTMIDFQAHVRGETPRYEHVFRVRHKDGDWRWILSRGLAVRDAAGRALRVVGTHTDITGQKRLESQLFEAKELAQVTLASIGDAVLTTDAEGNVTFLNPIAERLTGWRLDEVAGLPVESVVMLVDEETRAPLPNPATRCRESRVAIAASNHTLLINREGHELAINDSAAPILDRDGRLIGVVLIFHDVSHARELNRRMSWQLTHDALTGLYSRREFERQLRRMVEDARDQGHVHALLYMDLDQFKIVNDTAGHLAGDELLKQLGFLLSEQMRRGDVLARLGGDEFAALLENCPLDKAREIAEKLRATVGDFRFSWQERVFDVGVSIGLAMIDAETAGDEDALAAADMACYAAKDAGRNRVHVFERATTRVGERLGEMELAGAIRGALARGGFVLFSHEILALAGARQPRRLEVLARMVDPGGGLVSPGVFVPAAERYGFMAEIDRWVVRNAFALLAGARGEFADCVLFVNLSGLSLREEGMREYILGAANEHGIDPARICFEITETAAVAHLAAGVAFMRALKARGFRFALDDFGSGMSSFAYLKNLPVDYLKIDGAFVRDMAGDPVDRAFVETIHRVGHLMGKETIAEFVETEALLDLAREIGLDFVQGDVLGKPRPLDAVLAGY